MTLCSNWDEDKNLREYITSAVFQPYPTCQSQNLSYLSFPKPYLPVVSPSLPYLSFPQAYLTCRFPKPTLPVVSQACKPFYLPFSKPPCWFTCLSALHSPSLPNGCSPNLSLTCGTHHPSSPPSVPQASYLSEYSLYFVHGFSLHFFY